MTKPAGKTVTTRTTAAKEIHEFIGQNARKEREARRRLTVELTRCKAMTSAVAFALGAAEGIDLEALAGLAELLEGISVTAGIALALDRI